MERLYLPRRNRSVRFADTIYFSVGPRIEAVDKVCGDHRHQNRDDDIEPMGPAGQLSPEKIRNKGNERHIDAA